MNWLDIVIIIALVLSAFMGYKAGLIKMLFLLAGVIIGVVLAGQYVDSLALKLTFISDVNLAGIVAFIIILLATLIVALILAFIVERLAHWALLGWLDNLGGIVFALLLCAIFIGALLAMYLRYQGPSDTVTSSPIADFLLNKFWVVLGLLPDQFSHIRSYF
jgi:membrane protein required for colicin V production